MNIFRSQNVLLRFSSSWYGFESWSYWFCFYEIVCVSSKGFASEWEEWVTFSGRCFIEWINFVSKMWLFNCSLCRSHSESQLLKKPGFSPFPLLHQCDFAGKSIQSPLAATVTPPLSVQDTKRPFHYGTHRWFFCMNYLLLSISISRRSRAEPGRGI